MKPTWPLLILAIVMIAYCDLEQRINLKKHPLSKADILGFAIPSFRYYANLDVVRERKPAFVSRDNYTSDDLSELPLMVEVYVEQDGERRLTDAFARLYDSNTGTEETYELSAKRNDIIIDGEPDIFYEFIVEKEGYWPSTTYFTYGELAEKLLEIVLVDSTSAPGPAVLFDPSATIFNMRLQMMDTGTVLLDWRNGEPADTIEFAVDPNDEAGTAFISREMGFVTSLPRAKITGDVHLIKGIYFDADADGLNARAATGLQILSLLGGVMERLDLSANDQLRSLRMEFMDPINEFVLSEQHHINNLVIFGSGFPTDTQLDYTIENIYSNAVEQNIFSGRIELVDAPVSTGAASKLLALKNNYQWEVVVTPPLEEPDGAEDFSVVDTRNGNKLVDFLDSVTLDAGHPDFNNWTIQANTQLDNVGSVVFKIDVQKKNTENKAPYLLAGHHLRALTPTPHILETESYSGRLGSGNRLQSRAALITFTNNTIVSSLAVIDSDGKMVQELNDGDVVDAGNPLLRNFNVEAFLNRESPRASVQFYVNGQPFWTENREPYIMVNGNRKWWEAPGTYTITAVPYSKRNGGGLAGIPRTVTFTISDNAADQFSTASRMAEDSHHTGDKDISVSVYPVPAKDVLFVLPGNEFIDQDALVVIRDHRGELLFEERIRITSEPYALELSKVRLKNTVYYLQVITKNSSKNIRFIKE